MDCIHSDSPVVSFKSYTERSVVAGYTLTRPFVVEFYDNEWNEGEPCSIFKFKTRKGRDRFINDNAPDMEGVCQD